MTSIIRTSKLTKAYHELLAVDHVDVEVKEGAASRQFSPHAVSRYSYHTCHCRAVLFPVHEIYEAEVDSLIDDA